MNIGGYEIGQVFHVGARGPLWRTRSSDGEALLALRSSDDGERLLDRWKAWASVSSRHVVALRDVVRSDDGRWAIVQDFVSGRPLDVEIGSADLRPKATRRQIVEGIAAGMSALHGAGIVHGDLTPANIIVTPQGRAVIIDIIDEIGPGAGTPGWSLETSGMEGDRQCLRRIASLLQMDEVLAELGFDELAATVGSGATPLVCDPVEHVIAREPIDPERVIADLRAAALREDTLTEDEVRASHMRRGAASSDSSRSPHRKGLAALIVTCSVIVALGATVAVYGAWTSARMSQPSQVPPATTSTEDTPVGLCDPTAAADLINSAIQARDQAMKDGDASTLDAVLGGELLTEDAQRIEDMRAGGVQVRALSSSVQNVAIVSCEPDAVDARVTLLVSEAETCTASGCNLYGAPYSTYLDVRVDPISGKVVSATLTHASTEDAAQSGK
ncbi:protein kinase domain-containing protein [Actinomyces sp.]